MIALRRLSALLAVAATLVTASPGRASFQGTLYYTHFSGGGPNVLDISFTYDENTGSLSYGAQHGLATVNGADGIMFAPNGNLLVTSNSTSSVYRINPNTGGLLQTVSTGTAGFSDYHMALDPTGTMFYSSNRYSRTSGPLDTFAINPNGTIGNATTRPITGGDTNVTQLAFAPNGKVFYTNGNPNANGAVGLFNFGSLTDTTTQLFAANTILAAHGILYDPFTGLMTMFGGGAVATLDPNAGTNPAIKTSLKQFDVPGVSDFDQGSVDGFGHAFIAGSGAITFIDYSKTGDITSSQNRIIITPGFGAIDDVAPLVGLGAPPSATPAPGGLTLFALGTLCLGGGSWLRRKRLAS